MRSLVTRVFVVSVICGCVLAAKPAAAADQKEAVLQADRVLVQAVAKKDKTALAGMLDADFTSTDSTGQTRGKKQLLEDLTAAGALGSDQQVQARGYGDVGMVTAAAGKVRVLRVWVKRPAGWRVLVHQDTAVGSAGSGGPGSRDCENPCKTLPYQPHTAAQRGVIASWQAQETAETNHDSATWARTVADEFLVITSTRDHPNTKSDRMATFDKQKITGEPAAPLPLVSARMVDFPGVVVMTSIQQRGNGKPNHVTRLWIERDGRWQLAFSQQTVVQQAAAAGQ